LWSNGATTQNINNLAAGSYSVTVTDAYGCIQTGAFTVGTQSATITLNTSVVNVKCNGESSGSINLVVSGGTAPYTYLWSNGATTEDITNLTAGTIQLQLQMLMDAALLLP
jgi:hypothetical protein